MPNYDINSLVSQYGGAATDALLKPISDKVNAQIDKIAYQAKYRIADQRNVDPSEVSDLDVADYIIGMPTANTNAVLSEQMSYIGKCTRNGLIIGGALIGLGILVGKLATK